MTVILWAFSVLLGLAIGSFLNVVIHRVPRKESIVEPGSRCPECGGELKWWMNVPVVSYLWLRGRCAFCGQPISPRYVTVELLTGGLFLVAAVKTGFRFELLIDFLALAVVVAVSFIDLAHKIIPNRIMYPALVVILVLRLALSPQTALKDFLWGLAGGGFLLAVALIWPGGMGVGDVKLALFIGFWLGSPAMVALFLAFLVGAVVGMALIVTGRRSRKDTVPFGPFIGLGSVAAYLVGHQAIEFYIGLFAR